MNLLSPLPFLKRPSAFLPPVLSTLALSLIVIHYLIYGIVREVDEGTPAHIFQLLMVLQFPVIVFFAIKWLPLQPKPAALILAFQGVMALAAIGSVLVLT
jgi:hypothetical protein